MASLGDIVIGLSMDNRKFQSSAQQTRGTLASIGTSTMGVVGQVAGMLGVGGAIASIGWGVQLHAQAEQTQIAFEVMLGSGDAAKTMLADLKAYADKSPFSSIKTNEFAQQLLNYGIAGDKILPTIEMLGDVAAGDEQKFEGLARAFGQRSSTGRLTGGDLNQMINAGFNPLQEIAKKTGESMAVLKKRMEDGGVSAGEVEGAFKDATSEGGRFFGMTARQSETLAGKFSTMKDAVSTSLMTLGGQIAESLDFKGVLDHITAFASEIPYLFRNAGSLIQIAVIDWQIALYDFIPESQEVMQTVGAVLNATWEASVASFDTFVSNLKGGLQEIKNLALATWASIKAGVSAIAQGRNPLTAANDAFQSALANQDQPTSGESFASTFSEKFNETLRNSQEGFQDFSLTSGLKQQKEELLKGIVERESQLTPLAAGKASSSLTASEADTAEQDKKKEKAKKEVDNKASLIGSSEAAQTILRGAFGGQEQKTAQRTRQEQLAELKQLKAEVKAQKQYRPAVVNI